MVLQVSSKGTAHHRLALPRSKEPVLTYSYRTLFVSSTGLDHAKQVVTSYKTGHAKVMTPELWKAKQIVDSTIHPDTGQPVFLPARMSCFVISNLVVTGGMLTPNMGTRGTVFWQIANQSLNVAINSANANKSSPMSTFDLARNYVAAVSASCGVALGLNALVPRLKKVSPNTKMILGRLVPFAAVVAAGILNIFLMRSDEIRKGIDVFPTQSEKEKAEREKSGKDVESLGRSKKAATLAVAETAASRVINATPIMVLPPLILVRLQRTDWLKARPRMTLPVNLGLILTTSIFALPLALGAFPQRQAVKASTLESEFHDRAGVDGFVEFNRGL